MVVCSRSTLLFLASCLVTGCGDHFVKSRQSTSGSADYNTFPLPTGVVSVVIGDTSTHDPHYMTNASGEFVKIPVGCGFQFYQQIPIEPYAVVQEAPILRTLLDGLYPISQINEQGVTFSGVLSEQFYLNREDKLVLHVFIICNDSTVVISTNGSIVRMGNEYRYVPPTNAVTDVAIKRPEYVSYVYSLMQDHAPEQIQKRKDFYGRIGIDFEAQLFGGVTEPHAQ